jgi:lysozyme
MDRQALIDDLARDEGIKLYVYDDATALPVRPGHLMIGHPTIGIGRALDVHGVSKAEAYYLLNNDIDGLLKELAVRLPEFSKLDDPRQRTLCNMAFNLGVSGLLEFREMLAAIAQQKYGQAATCLLESKLGAQATSRAKRLAQLLQLPIQNA